LFAENIRQRNEINKGGWNELSENVIEAAKQVCGETTGHRRKQRETWWWNTVVQKVKKSQRHIKNGRNLALVRTKDYTRKEKRSEERSSHS